MSRLFNNTTTGLKILCETCNDLLEGKDAWFKHLTSPFHNTNTLQKQNNPETCFNENSLVVLNGDPKDALDILEYFSQIDFIHDFCIDYRTTFIAIQLKSRNGSDLAKICVQPKHFVNGKNLRLRPKATYVHKEWVNIFGVSKPVAMAHQKQFQLQNNTKIEHQIEQQIELQNQLQILNQKKPLMPPIQPQQSQHKTKHESNMEGSVKKRTKKNLTSATSEIEKYSLDEQLDLLLSQVTLDPATSLKRHRLLYDLASLLRVEFPKVIVHAFGSLITKLGDVQSDIDIYIDVTGKSASNLRFFPPVSIPEKKMIFKQVLRILRSNRYFCNQIIPLSKTRVPIIKIVHAETKTKCDLSFENILSVQNSKMIAFYLDFDPRVRPLVQLIREWGRFHRLTSPTSIKNYTLVLIVLTFLAEKQIVPSVHLLQSLVKEEDKITVDNEWEAHFSTNIVDICKAMDIYLPSRDKAPALDVLNLAYEFFAFHAKLDYGKFVISLFLGSYIPRELFEPGNEPQLSVELNRYKVWAGTQKPEKRLEGKNKCLCVQDPFSLGFNTGCSTLEGILGKFTEACQLTERKVKLFIENKNKNILAMFTHFKSTFEKSKQEKKIKKRASRKAYIDNKKLELVPNFEEMGTPPPPEEKKKTRQKQVKVKQETIEVETDQQEADIDIIDQSEESTNRSSRNSEKFQEKAHTPFFNDT